jgi:hypothetical protein
MKWNFVGFILTEKREFVKQSAQTKKYASTRNTRISDFIRKRET